MGFSELTHGERVSAVEAAAAVALRGLGAPVGTTALAKMLVRRLEGSDVAAVANILSRLARTHAHASQTGPEKRFGHGLCRTYLWHADPQRDEAVKEARVRANGAPGGVETRQAAALERIAAALERLAGAPFAPVAESPSAVVEIGPKARALLAELVRGRDENRADGAPHPEWVDPLLYYGPDWRTDIEDLEDAEAVEWKNFRGENGGPVPMVRILKDGLCNT